MATDINTSRYSFIFHTYYVKLSIFSSSTTLGDRNGANKTFITGYVIVLVIEKG